MGRPRIRGTDEDDVLDGTENAEEIRGDKGNDTLSGLGGDDRLRGEKGNDILNGGDGNDRLKGGNDNDTLTGGAGNDRFAFDLQGGTDTLTDFTHAEDKLDFTNFNIVATGTETAFEVLMSHAEQVGNDTVFVMDGGQTMILQNVLISILDLDDFRI